jgi:hypothetical protein
VAHAGQAHGKNVSEPDRHAAVHQETGAGLGATRGAVGAGSGASSSPGDGAAAAALPSPPATAGSDDAGLPPKRKAKARGGHEPALPHPKDDREVRTASGPILRKGRQPRQVRQSRRR